MSNRDTMIAEIKRVAQPFLRSNGFAGLFPHYRKKTSIGIDLVTIQFDRRACFGVAGICSQLAYGRFEPQI
jgi:hypothetical protein